MNNWYNNERRILNTKMTGKEITCKFCLCTVSHLCVPLGPLFISVAAELPSPSSLSLVSNCLLLVRDFLLGDLPALLKEYLLRTISQVLSMQITLRANPSADLSKFNTSLLRLISLFKEVFLQHR